MQKIFLLFLILEKDYHLPIYINRTKVYKAHHRLGNLLHDDKFQIK